ncbi:MAG: SRPBCC family protein [Planctomycetes bacterium]|nr:SRPBCC family protein [Planctomycetota bacterium]
MIMFRETVKIRCTPETAWAVVTDMEKVQKWNPKLREFACESESAPGLGKHYLVSYSLKGRVTDSDAEITEWHPFERYTLKMTEAGKGGMGDRVCHEKYEFEDLGGETAITQSVEIDLGGAPFLIRFVFWVISHLSLFGDKVYLHDLKRMVENGEIW